MAYIERRHPLLEKVYTVVTRENPAYPPELIATVLGTAADFYRKLLAERDKLPENRSEIPEPEVLDHPIFQRMYPSFVSAQGKPLVALRAGIAADIPFQQKLKKEEVADEVTDKVGAQPVALTDIVTKTELEHSTSVALPAASEGQETVSEESLQAIIDFIFGPESKQESENTLSDTHKETVLIEPGKKKKRKKPGTKPKKEAKDDVMVVFETIRRASGLPAAIVEALLVDAPHSGDEASGIRYPRDATLAWLASAPVPRADSETGLYTAEDASVWIPRSQISSRLGLSQKDAKAVAIGMSTRPVLTSANRTQDYFSEAQLKERAGIVQQEKQAKAQAKQVKEARPARRVDRPAVKMQKENKRREASRRATRPDATEWPSEKQLGDEFGLSAKVVHHILRKDPGQKWSNQRLHNRSVAEPQIITYLEQRRVEAGLIVVEGKLSAPLNYFHLRFGLTYEKLRQVFDGLETREGFRGAQVYVIDDAMVRLSPLLAIPQVDDETGVVTKKNGRMIAPLATIAEILGISYDKALTYTEDMLFDDIKTRGGMPTRGYDVEHVRSRAASYLVRPSVGDKIGEDQSERLVRASTLAGEFDLEPGIVRSILATIAMPVRGSTHNAYPDRTARVRLAAFVALPELEKENQTFTDPSGEVYVSNVYAIRELHMDTRRFSRYEELGILRSLSARLGGREMQTYSLSDLRHIKTHPLPKARPVRRPRPSVDKKPAILAEARTAFERFGTLDRKTLRGNHLSGLAVRIEKNFDGNYAEVLETFGVEVAVPQRNRWSEMEDPGAFVRTSVTEYMTAHPKAYKADDVKTILSEVGISYAQVNLHYPVSEPGLSGYTQLQKDLDFAPTRIQWDKMETEERNDMFEAIAQGFLDKGIDLQTQAIRPHHSTFVRMVNRYYTRNTGGMKGLQEQKGVYDPANEPIKWKDVADVPATIRALVREELAGKELKTTNLKSTTVSIIYSRYPGKWQQFVKDYI